MSIPTNLRGRYAYHFTAVHNLDSIIDNGLLCTNSKKCGGITHFDIAAQSIQTRRGTMDVPCAPGTKVHDYVPFYFAKKTPMQLNVINSKNIDQYHLIYFAIPIEVLIHKPGVVFTDASANRETAPNFYNVADANMLDTLNWDAIDSQKWSCPTEEFRHQKMAELLVPGTVAIEDVAYIAVWNSDVKEGVKQAFNNKNKVPPELKFDDMHHYLNFYDGGRQSIITGPVQLKSEFEDTVSKICECSIKVRKHPTVAHALDAIANSFDSIKELKDIDGLKANYGPHNDDVGTHSWRVANNLSNFEEFQTLDARNKDIVSLAAYLHDIGKGPKSRWTNDTMDRADNDHAAKSLPMLQRILTEDIDGLNHDDIRKIVMLVTYDDLVGDIVAKGRNREQLFEIVKSKDDVNMLIAIAKADMSAINKCWVSDNDWSIEQLKSEALKRFR